MYCHLQNESELAILSPLTGDIDLTGVGAEVSLSEISLSCDECLEPPEEASQTNGDPTPLNPPPPLLPFPEEMTYPSFLPTTPYFSYSPAPTDLPILGSPSFNPNLPPSSSLLCSPELPSHLLPPTSSLILDATTPPLPYPHPCGQDIWLAIGCN